MRDNPNLLVSKLFKGKYGDDPISVGYQGRSPYAPSWAARSLIKAASSLKGGIQFRVGNGHCTKITRDSWVGMEKVHFRNHIPPWFQAEAKVMDIMTTERNWNAGLIWKSFTAVDARKILATHIPAADKEDEMIWAHTKTGKYTFKSGYWFLHRQQQPSIGTHSKFWKALWKSNLLPKWKHFIWRVIHRAIPTKENLRKRGMEGEETCSMCHAEVETQNHIFRLCPVSQMVWKSSWLGIISYTQMDIGVEDWIMNFLNLFFNQDGEEDSRLLQFISILWSIWLHRNEIIFRNVSVSPERILHLAQSHVHQWTQAQKLLAARQKDEREVSLPAITKGITIFKYGRCSTEGFICLVVDAAWKASSKGNCNQWQAAVGWEEDTDQEPRLSGATKIFALSPLQAECQAILWGTRLAASFASNVVVKSDCLEAVQAIKNPSKAVVNIVPIIEDIRLVAKNLDYFVCIKVSRTQVSKAHILAQRERNGK